MIDPNSLTSADLAPGFSARGTSGEGKGATPGSRHRAEPAIEDAPSPVAEFLKRWAESTERRMRAAHPQRPAWNACRRRLFVEQLQRDCPALSETERMLVLAAFDAVAERAVIRGVPGMPDLPIPGRVRLMAERLDVGDILSGRYSYVQ